MKEGQFLQPHDPESSLEGNELPFHPDEIESSDEMRLYLTKKLGLPEDTPMDEVREVEDKQYNSELAHLLGLPEGSTHEDVLAEEERRGVPNLAYNLSLGISEDLSRKYYEASNREEFEGELREAYLRQKAKHRKVLEKVAQDMIINRAKNITPKNPNRLSG